MSFATKEQIIEKLKTVKDPELGIDVWTLGLIYKIETEEEGIDILMTLTSPFCPFAEELIASVEKALIPLYPEVRVNITFDPPWEPTKELRTMLGV
ncbi:MAG: hypothetical protein A2648_02015 [Candidatus Lloydbacteria bacterium RIFCSPHIGHO2_01_FULL_41_20]|uniref:MIP18 family-like domain-containing protein n=1 Tax=Candidatus Lloydbacteria bacterium RIFCSPHIGHO2_01_FULL_41_20 TaxID=1798657 RepID=A0A1G2CRG1_9BACT|nr:MAG: hypothetical protein A2648_02015 [Candidatus Lloydbacteria bacterium RIFCSPHIGHO2_01_FULL_41_20]